MNVFTLARRFDEIDTKLVLESLAQEDPEAFLRACRNIDEDALFNPTKAQTVPEPEPNSEPEIDPVFLEKIVWHIKDGNIIGAIKELRAHAGVGLKEAKDAVFYWIAHPDRNVNLDSWSREMAEALMRAHTVVCVKVHADPAPTHSSVYVVWNRDADGSTNIRNVVTSYDKAMSLAEACNGWCSVRSVT